jgi:hypothetical protein
MDSTATHGGGAGHNSAGSPGTANTGGGGGGCGWNQSGGAGGSGIVVVRYTIPGSITSVTMAGDLPVSVDLTGDLRTFVAVETDPAGLGMRVDFTGELHVGPAEQTLTGDLGVAVNMTGRLSVGRVLPPTVWSWTAPVSRGELLRTMRIRLATRDGEYTVVDPSEFQDISIEQTRKGGLDSMTFVLARDSRLELGDLDYKTNCDVDYLGRQLHAWVRESSLEHGEQGMRRTVTLLGWITRLKEEHEAFRRVYVDSRLSAWRTDQGASGSASTFEVGAP